MADCATGKEVVFGRTLFFSFFLFRPSRPHHTSGSHAPFPASAWTVLMPQGKIGALSTNTYVDLLSPVLAL